MSWIRPGSVVGGDVVYPSAFGAPPGRPPDALPRRPPTPAWPPPSPPHSSPAPPSSSSPPPAPATTTPRPPWPCMAAPATPTVAPPTAYRRGHAASCRPPCASPGSRPARPASAGWPPRPRPPAARGRGSQAPPAPQRVLHHLRHTGLGLTMEQQLLVGDLGLLLQALPGTAGRQAAVRGAHGRDAGHRFGRQAARGILARRTLRSRLGQPPLTCGGSYWSHEGGEAGHITLNGATDDGSRTVTVSMSTSFNDLDETLRQHKAASDLVDHELCDTSSNR